MKKGTALGPTPGHGTRERYQSRIAPCRCELCRAANALAVRTWRYHGVTHVEPAPTR